MRLKISFISHYKALIIDSKNSNFRYLDLPEGGRIMITNFGQRQAASALKNLTPKDAFLSINRVGKFLNQIKA